MRISERIDLINTGDYKLSPAFKLVTSQIDQAISKVAWPPGNSQFEIFPESGKKRGQGNGVTPIKSGFITYLQSMGWIPEHRMKGQSGSVPGAFDAYLNLVDVAGIEALPFAVEWETGNISSSHRAINRLALGIYNNWLSGGILILPTRSLAQYLTDRIGNEPELTPYYPLWRQWQTLSPSAYLGIIAVEYDATSSSVPRIPKGTDGRALL